MTTSTLDEEFANRLGRRVVEASGPGWSSRAGWFNGQGGRQLLVKFQREGWTGTPMSPGKFERENYNVHVEIDLTRATDWVLALHFETEGYKPQEELRELDGYEEFDAMRTKFREAVHNGIQKGSTWKPRNYPLQVCKVETGLSAEASEHEMVSVLADALTQIRPVADGALAAVREAR